MNKQDALVESISLTNQILCMLEEEDTDAISELDARRLPLIQQAFSDSLETIDHIKAQHLQNLNQQVVEKLKEIKQAVLQQQQKVQYAAKATRAYSSYHLG